MADSFAAATTVLFLVGMLGLGVGAVVVGVVDRFRVGAASAPEDRMRTRASPAARVRSRSALVVAATSAAFVGVTWWFIRASSTSVGPATWVVLAAYLYLVAISLILTIVDISAHRLPNVVVLPSYVVGLAFFGLACAMGAPWETCCAR